MKQINEKLESANSGLSEPYSPSKYPTFVYSDDDELPIPCCGTMLIKYEETRKVKEVRNGKTEYTCTIAVKEIVSVEAEEGEEEDEGDEKDLRADAALDKIRDALEEAGEDED